MVTMAQRITVLREERGLSRPALSAALGFPRLAVEKFETGRLTPSQEQQDKLAAYFGVSLLYLRGESGDRVRMDDWMNDAYAFAEPAPAPAPAPKRPAAPQPVAASAGGSESTVFDSFLDSPKFRKSLREVVLEVLRSPEGRELLAEAARRK